MYALGSYKKLLTHLSDKNTVFLSLYLYTPKAGFPGINRPSLYTIDHKQNPR